jgi:integrase
MNVQDFVTGEYFPHIESTLAASTVQGYKKMWRAFGPYLAGDFGDYKVVNCQRVLREICAANPHLNRTTVRHLKHLFSGIWTCALRAGVIEYENPWRHAAAPTAPDAKETVAYSPEEIKTMVKVLPAPHDLIVLFFAYTGVRKSEARGVQWRDFDATTSTLSIERVIWQKVVKTTKNKSSKNTIPVVPALAARLIEFRQNAPANAFIFRNSNGDSLDLDNEARREIRPRLYKAGIRWVGYHGFRRALATLLHSQGIPDKEIQRVMRHGDVGTTQRAYVKVLPESVRRAMDSVNFEGGTKVIDRNGPLGD